MSAPSSRSPEIHPEHAVLTAEVTEPAYHDALDWMRSGPLPQVSYDCWARGNYTRRLIWHRQQGIAPTRVLVRSVGEIAWAYRRLALLGTPVDFVYSGPLPPPAGVLHLHPTNLIFDGGWGYIAWPHEPVRIRGRGWVTITGTAQPMPEEIVAWLRDEGAEPFARGEVFVAPSELIGFTSDGVDAGLTALSELTGAPAFSPDADTARTLLSIDLPYLDGLSVRAIERFRRDHDAELHIFRAAFGKLVRQAQASGDVSKTLVDEVRTAIAELQRSQKYAGLQRAAVKLGGVFAVCSASIGAILQQSPSLTLKALGFAGINAAGIALLDLLKQARQAKAVLAQNPFYVLWKLGLQKPAGVRLGRQVLSVPNIALPPHEIPRATHWLCPPRGGFLIAGVRKTSGRT